MIFTFSLNLKGDFNLSRQLVTNSSKIPAANEKVAVQCDSDDSDDEMATSTPNIQSNQYLFGVPHGEVDPNAPKSKPNEPNIAHYY